MKLERRFASLLILVCTLDAFKCTEKDVSLPNRVTQDFLAGSGYWKIDKTKAPNYTLSATHLLNMQALALL